MNVATSTQIPDHVPADLVQDWAFDSIEGVTSNPPQAMDGTRDERPIIYAPRGRRGRGTWVVKSYPLIVEAFQTPEIFSSDRYSGFSQLLGEDWPMLPLEVDPPLHRPYRMFLNKVFSPSRMSMLEEGITEFVADMVEKVKPLGKCDFQEAVALPVPTTVFLRLMGLPLEDAPLFLEWEKQLLHGTVIEERATAARAIKDYLVDTLKARKANPKDDVVSYIANSEFEGRALTDQEQLGMAYVLYGAGLDTVAAGLGFFFKFLAENPDRQEELRANPDLRPKAMEEMLRANSMVVSGRFVTKDVEFHGVQMRKGDYVSLPTMFGNRDPNQFADPTKVDFERRDVMRHIAFGSGAHNCLGSHLARRELKIVLDAWLDNLPPFRIAQGDRAVTYGGSVFGVDYLPLEW